MLLGREAEQRVVDELLQKARGGRSAELVVYVMARSERVQLGLDLVAVGGHGDVLQRAGGQQLIQRAGPRLHLLGLVLRTLDRQAHVAHLLRDPGDGLTDAGSRPRRQYRSP
jgi:hypothetical protein